jgi:hypothetical protein
MYSFLRVIKSDYRQYLHSFTTYCPKFKRVGCCWYFERYFHFTLCSTIYRIDYLLRDLALSFTVH